MTGNNTYESFDLASVVRHHRKQAGLNQKDLARLAGVGKTAIFDIENGKLTMRYQTLLKVFKALNIELAWESPLKVMYQQSNQD